MAHSISNLNYATLLLWVLKYIRIIIKVTQMVVVHEPAD